MTQPLRLVRIVWEDASIVDSGTWVQRFDLPTPDVIVFDQVGYLFELTTEHVVISSCVGKDLIGPRDRIPIGMVRSIQEFDQAVGKAVPIPKKRRIRKTV